MIVLPCLDHFVQVVQEGLQFFVGRFQQLDRIYLKHIHLVMAPKNQLENFGILTLCYT
jgi:hypothetical protein